MAKKQDKTGHHKKGAITANQRAFLAAFRETGNVSAAARSAGVARSRHYAWLDESQAYQAAYADAEEEAADTLEAEARRRAVRGVRKLKFYQGEPILDPETQEPYVEHEYSDTLLIFLLKGRRPEVFGDRTRHEVTGKDRGPIQSGFPAGPMDPETRRLAGQLYDRMTDGADGDGW